MTVGHMQYPRSSHNSAAEYTVAGIPYVTSSVYNEVTSTAAIQVSFPYVTQWISVQSVGFGGLQVGFTENGVKGAETANYFIVSSGSLATAASTTSTTSAGTGEIRVRCKELWIVGLNSNDPAKKAGFSVVAGLTSVKSRDFPTITGSAGFEGVG